MKFDCSGEDIFWKTWPLGLSPCRTTLDGSLFHQHVFVILRFCGESVYLSGHSHAGDWDWSCSIHMLEIQDEDTRLVWTWREPPPRNELCLSCKTVFKDALNTKYFFVFSDTSVQATTTERTHGVGLKFTSELYIKANHSADCESEPKYCIYGQSHNCRKGMVKLSWSLQWYSNLRMKSCQTSSYNAMLL